MKIRKAKLSDLNAILDSMRKRKDWHVQARKFVKSYIQNKHNFFFICLDDNKIVGSISGELWDDKGFAYLGEITAKGKNKKEVIKVMFDYFVAFCKKKKITLINTYVRKNKQILIDLYKDLGMKKKSENFYFEKRI